jgi:hypothetical protein
LCQSETLIWIGNSAWLFCGAIFCVNLKALFQANRASFIFATSQEESRQNLFKTPQNEINSSKQFLLSLGNVYIEEEFL